MSETETWYPLFQGDAPSPPSERAQESGTWNWWGAAPETRRGRLPFDGSRVSHVVTALVAVAVLSLVFYGTIVAPLLIHFDVLEGQEGTVTAQGLRGGLFENALTMLGLPLLWVAVFYRDGIKAAAWRLRLRMPHPSREISIGVVAGILAIVASMVVSLLVGQFVETPPNELVQDLARVITWPLVITLAIVSGTTEEVFFRGFLQNRVGIVPTNILFGFAHLSYGTPLQVIIPLALGFLFSALVVRTRSLTPAIVAHMLFNGIQLGLAKWAVEAGLA